MKTVSKIAQECGVSYDTVDSAVSCLEIKKENYLISKIGEELIHRYLFMCGKFSELTIESKMNYL